MSDTPNLQEALAFEAYAELDDGTKYAGLRVRPKTMLQLEKTARMRNWGGIETAPLTSMIFMSWHAGKLAGKHDLTFEAFEDAAISAGCEPTDPAEDDDAEVRPTSAAPGTTPQ